MTLCAVTLDCTDPMALAAFYVHATGLARVDGSNADFAGLRGPGGFFLGFQRVEDYHAPNWPGQQEPQQVHLDFEVDDLERAELALLRLGAGKPSEQLEGRTSLVLTDPAGHPFCLTTSRTVRRR
jgi:catechol 2,3-dioxygenase-like lactoylglutathione lyase family enzyme